MFDRMLKFFIDHSRINYTLFVLIFAVGVWSYIKTPKEVMPIFDLDRISISGSYSGASVDILDKMAVAEIEDNIKNNDSIETMTTTISPGRFTISLELIEGSDKYKEADEIKDSITLVVPNLPSDMDEPTVKALDRSRSLIELVITSDKLTLDELNPYAEDLKSALFNIEGVSDVSIYGDSDKFFEVILDERKIEALGLSKNSVFNIISELSYIFPIGKIEDPKQHFYISTHNGAKTAQEFEDTLIKIDGKTIYVKDIAKISKKYEETSTLYSSNGQTAISLTIEQLGTANGITMAAEVKKLIPKFLEKKPDIGILVVDDDSSRIKDRLGVVMSNILLGIILITILVTVLINLRMSIIIAIGIPTSFVMGAAYLYLSGYSINMMSLVGVLIALGIVVDDAIVVSENIQQYLEEGYTPKEAAFKGASEMVKPVTIASLTTLFSFLPILMISGTMGQMMMLVPIALSALVVASLVESFIFLPIHAAHTLKTGSKVTSWEKPNAFYNKIIKFCINWKKSFIITFIILVPLLTFYFIDKSRFSMFPKFDASFVQITLKANQNTSLEESFEIVKSVEQDLLKLKEELGIFSIDSIAGWRRSLDFTSENFPYSMFITLELEKQKADNFVDKYITPYLSFYYEEEGRTREISSIVIAKKLKEFLAQQNYKEKFGLEEVAVIETRPGPVKVDIQIGLVTADNQKAIKSVKLLQDEIDKIKGVKSSSNSLKFGIDEIKIKVNSYGATLGLTEQSIGNYLSNLYLLKKKAVSFDEEEMMDIKIESKTKDSFENLKKTLIPLEDGTFVALEEVVELNTIQAFEKIVKDEGVKNFYVYANVDADIITSNEALDKLKPTLEQLEEDGVKVILKGEFEKTTELRNDMLLATALAILLIAISMLYLFNSFSETLILMSVIPFSTLGVFLGHDLMGLSITMPSLLGMLGLAGVVINDGIIMMTYLKKAKTEEEIFFRATKRLRPIVITTVTTLVGMATLIFFPSGEARIFQPIAVALGFGLAWGTVLNLIYLPTLYTLTHKLKNKKSKN